MILTVGRVTTGPESDFARHCKIIRQCILDYRIAGFPPILLKLSPWSMDAFILHFQAWSRPALIYGIPAQVDYSLQDGEFLIE